MTQANSYELRGTRSAFDDIHTVWTTYVLVAYRLGRRKVYEFKSRDYPTKIHLQEAIRRGKEANINDARRAFPDAFL